jgi:hypothetical protein
MPDSRLHIPAYTHRCRHPTRRQGIPPPTTSAHATHASRDPYPAPLNLRTISHSELPFLRGSESLRRHCFAPAPLGRASPGQSMFNDAGGSPACARPHSQCHNPLHRLLGPAAALCEMIRIIVRTGASLLWGHQGERMMGVIGPLDQY